MEASSLTGLDVDCDLPRVAVLGTGSAGMRHLAVLQVMGGGPPIAVPKRKSRIEQLKGEGYCTASDLEDAARRGASMCVIASDPSRHFEDCFRAQSLGLHVLVEKPLAINTAQACRLAERARNIERRLFVGCNLRFSRSLERFRELLPRLGRLHSVRIACQSYLPDWRPNRPYLESYSARQGEGGVLLDLIHEIDYAAWIFGWPTRVMGRLKNSGQLGIETEEMADLSWETPDGCVVSIGLDYLSRIPFRGMRTSGSEGTMEWDGIQGTVTLMLAGQTEEEVRLPMDHNGTFSSQARAFIGACGGTPDDRLCAGEEGARSLAICDAVRLSSASGSEVAVEQFRASASV